MNFVIKTHGQSTDSLTATQKFARDNKFFHYFLFQDSTSQNYLFTVGLKYQYTAITKSFSSNGAYVHLGLNLARFFSKKIIFGVFYDLRPIHGPFFYQPTSNQFKNDFVSNFSTTYSSPEDSAVAYTLKNAIENKSLSSGSFANLGLMFSPFPNKYGGLLFSFKISGCDYRVGGVYGNKLILNGEADNIYFSVGKNYVYEISFKPFAFKHNTYFNFDKPSSESKFLKTFTCSIYYERFNLKNATFGDNKFKDMVSSAFLSKYGSTDRFGVSIGWTLY